MVIQKVRLGTIQALPFPPSPFSLLLTTPFPPLSFLKPAPVSPLSSVMSNVVQTYEAV